jgi:hypothetical protein
MPESFSEKKLHKIGRIDQIVRDHFESNPSLNDIAAKDMMDIFIAKGIFLADHHKGFPIRELLRLLDKENKLHLIKHVSVVRHKQSRNWSFVRK